MGDVNMKFVNVDKPCAGMAHCDADASRAPTIMASAVGMSGIFAKWWCSRDCVHALLVNSDFCGGPAHRTGHLVDSPL